jgi:hypothetical protein
MSTICNYHVSGDGRGTDFDAGEWRHFTCQCGNQFNVPSVLGVRRTQSVIWPCAKCGQEHTILVPADNGKEETLDGQLALIQAEESWPGAKQRNLF